MAGKGNKKGQGRGGRARGKARGGGQNTIAPDHLHMHGLGIGFAEHSHGPCIHAGGHTAPVRKCIAGKWHEGGCIKRKPAISTPRLLTNSEFLRCLHDPASNFAAVCNQDLVYPWLCGGSDGALEAPSLQRGSPEGHTWGG